MNIGVLAVQGDFAEHIAILRKIGVDALEVRLPEQLEPLDGLIIPGGESTTLSRLMSHISSARTRGANGCGGPRRLGKPAPA